MRTVLKSLLLFTCLFLFGVNGYALTLYVDQNNLNANGSGSIDNPFQTIQTALDSASTGDVILVSPGVYQENLTIHTQVSLIAEQGATTISASGTTTPTIKIGVNGVTVRGFTITGSANAGISFASSGEFTSNSTITGNLITGNGIGLYGWRTSGNRIENNQIANNGTGLFYDYDGAGSLITGNEFTGNTKAAIQFNLFCGGNTIAENNFTNNAVALKLNQRSAGTKIYHNNFIGNSTQVVDYATAPVLWEDGYVAGGNYWDNYSGPDSNADGIIDQPNGRDFFPVPEPNGWTKIVPEQSVRNLTSGKAYPTIGAAMADANAGDVIETAAGTITGHGMYYENVAATVPVVLTAPTGGATITARNYAGNVISMKTSGVTVSGFTLRGATSAAGISFAGIGERTDNHTISGNLITGNSIGLYGWRTYGNKIETNQITGNGTGLYYEYDGAGSLITGNDFTGNTKVAIQFNLFCGGNTIAENNFTNNALALKLAIRSAGTTIYHNNFIGNATQVVNYSIVPVLWENGYVDGGNYWDNYSGPDSNADGIIDQPNGRDFFPVPEPNGWTKIVPEQSVRNLTSGMTYPTIGAAMAEANPGDVIETAAGTITGHGMYYENLAATVPVVLTAPDGGATITARNYAVNIISMKTSGVTVRGFTLQGATSAAGISFAGIGERTDNHTISGNLITGNSIGLYGWRTFGNKIENNKIANNGIGLHFYYDGGNCLITGNDFTGNTKAAIQFNLFGGGNTITENNFTSNTVGLNLFQRDAGSKIYHNNFIGNATHVVDYAGAQVTWDDNYPSGGNHWDNWTAPDLFSGVSQDISGADGIVDQAYLKDRYPFVEPNGWQPKDTPPVAVAGPDLQVFVGEPVTLDASASWDAQGPIQSYAWSFGDGTAYTESLASATDGVFDGKNVHVFTQAGVYDVALVVVDGGGLSATDTATVTVSTISTGIDQLAALVTSFNLDKGPENALLAKLRAAQDALAAGDTFTAKASLEDFLAQITAAGFGKNKLPDGFLEVVVPAATRLINLL